MTYKLLKRIIESNNPYVDTDYLSLLMMNFLVKGSITQEEYGELNDLITL